MASDLVPVLSIIFMGVSALIGFGLPLILFFIWRKKYDLKVAPALVGAAAFFIFAMILEQLLHAIVLRPASDGTIALTSQPFFYVLYGTLAAGVFEETARFFSFHFLKKKYQNFGTSLSYGIGHGGIECIMILGFSMISTLIFSLTINTGAAATLGDSSQVLATIETLTTSSPILFLAGGFERILAMTIHISLSVLVWTSVNRTGKWWLYPVSILLHALANTAAALLQCGVLKSIILVEAITCIAAILLAVIAVFTMKKLNLTAPVVEVFDAE